MLGAEFSLIGAPQGKLTVSNKTSRITSLEAMVDEVCSGTSVGGALLASLKGRLMYAATHTFGRVALMAVKLLSKLLRAGGPVLLQEHDKRLIRQCFEMIRDARPRVIQVCDVVSPIIIFTDGACEQQGNLVTYGAVLIDTMDGSKQVFGEEVPRQILETWKRGNKEQVVGQAEILPVVVAKVKWKDILARRRIIWFIDNESARCALAAGSSPVLASFAMLCVNAHLDAGLEALSWFTRVPSAANLADDASRLVFDNYEKEYVRCTLNWSEPALKEVLKACCAV